MKIEVLVATMNQKDSTIYEKMNLKTDAVFANQADRYEYQCFSKQKSKVKMITTSERGVGKNRNTALMYATGDICIFGDDDMIYVDNYEELVRKAFKELPQSVIIIFNIETVGVETRSRRLNTKIKKVHIFNALNYGAARIAVRREELMKKNIWFSLLYGGGALYSSGEDSLFLTEALRKGMKIYTYPVKIADIEQGRSTWFNGYTEKYFEDRGVWIANAFPRFKYLLSIYYSYRLRNVAKEFSAIEIFKIINRGIKKFARKIRE